MIFNEGVAVLLSMQSWYGQQLNGISQQSQDISFDSIINLTANIIFVSLFEIHWTIKYWIWVKYNPVISCRLLNQKLPQFGLSKSHPWPSGLQMENAVPFRVYPESHVNVAKLPVEFTAPFVGVTGSSHT
jgi:hypothetical protein